MKKGLVTMTATALITLATMTATSLMALATTGIGTAFAATTANNETYTVQPGDTLYKIAVAQGVPLTALEAANPQITNFDNISPGQVLNILDTYVVQPGDTFYKIAVAKAVSLTQLEATNPQISDYLNLLVGQAIHVPATVSTQSSPPTVPMTSSSSSSSPSSSSSSSKSPSSTSSSSTSTTQLRQNIINYANAFVGVPYIWGGQTPSGFDCSGFTTYVYAHFGMTLPRQSHDQATAGTSISQANLQPGDLLFFQYTDSLASKYANHVTHVGIYIGNGAMLEAGSSNGVVLVQNVFSNSYWMGHYYGARDVIG